MKRILTSPAGLAVVLLVLFLATLACSLTKPSQQEDVQNALATLTMMVWTPTAPFTQTPLASPTLDNTLTPTETPPPTLTPTPSYDWCLGMNTRVVKEADINVGPSSGDEGFAAYACLVEVVGPVKHTFAETALKVKLGFNDQNGVLHIYPAIIGGLLFTKPKAEEFSYPACYAAQNPKQLNLGEYVASLSAYMSEAGKPFPVLISTKFGYQSHNPAEASQVNRYEDIHPLLKDAVETGQGFPDVPEHYQLFILPGLVRCQ
jgi:hypothetical protein